MKDDPHSHLKQHAHPSTTVMHHPGEDQTVLGRWLMRGLEMGPAFWVALATVVVGAIVATLLASRVFTGESTDTKAWMELTVARTSDQQVNVAQEFPKTPAGRWARLEAAGSVYNRAFDLLPQSKDDASPLLKRAYALYSEAYEEAEKIDPPLARMAALGMGRTLEASNDLPRAREQYKKVASTWPGTDEAKLAEHLAKALGDKRNVEFYDWLAKYKPSEVTLPPLGKSLLDLPSPLGSFGNIPPPLSPSGVPAGLPSGAHGGGELPTNIFEPPAPPASPTPAPASVPLSAPPSSDSAPPPAQAPAAAPASSPSSPAPAPGASDEKPKS